jgi:hypothetical protein
MNRSISRCALALGLLAWSVAHSAAYAAVATFDSLSEGFYGTELIDGGIRFFDPDYYIPGEQTEFAIDRADENLGGDPFFSSPNGMAMGGYSPGPIGGGSRFGSVSFELEGGGRGDAASVELWFNQLDGPNSVILAAYFGGVLVDATAVGGPINCCDVHRHLELSGIVFDSLRLFGVGPANDGAAFMLVDNVTISGVPLPAGLWLMGSACAAVAGFMRRGRRNIRRA